MRLMVYDKSDLTSGVVPIGLTHSWFLGGHIYRAMRWIDVCEGFWDWDSALKWIYNKTRRNKVEQIQIWGHGGPGRSQMHKDRLTVKDATHGNRSVVLKHIAKNLPAEGLIWFRNCSMFAGEKGHEFARTWSRELDCRIAAHTHTISAWQSGLHSISPGDEPHWHKSEGIAAGTVSQPTKFVWSRPWLPNTVFMLNSGVPNGW